MCRTVQEMYATGLSVVINRVEAIQSSIPVGRLVGLYKEVVFILQFHNLYGIKASDGQNERNLPR